MTQRSRPGADHADEDDSPEVPVHGVTKEDVAPHDVRDHIGRELAGPRQDEQDADMSGPHGFNEGLDGQ
ncbi:MAG: hypothetical protein ACR2KL_14170 [Nocardioidaceae bacterium]